MKAVLVTGGLGYIGKATAKVLEEQGYVPILTDKKVGVSTENIFKLGSLIYTIKPIGIIHLSAKKSIGESKKRPLVYYWNNISSTISVFILCKLFNLPAVFASSAAVYEPTNPYAKSKLIEERIISRIKSSVILRYFNVGGKAEGVEDETGQNIFAILNKTHQEQRVFTINSPTTTRDYTHVLDIAKANVCALEYSLTSTQPLLTDVFSGKQHSVLEVIEAYRKNGLEIKCAVREAQDKTIYPFINNLHKLNWTPTYSFLDIVCSEKEVGVT
jgi:UDP-glucose 4-epimerase